MRLAMLRAATSSSLGAAQVLAAPAPAMRLAGTRVAYGRLEAPLLLAAFAAAMRDAVKRAACSSRLGAALRLATPATAMRRAVLHATQLP